MYCSGHLRILILTAATVLAGTLPALARNPTSVIPQPPISQENPQTDGRTTVRVRWAARPGVSRYRLQLASDRGFSDIVLDRVVAGNEYQLTDLAPGTYFWRIAPLTTKLGEFSSGAAIEVSRQTERARAQNEAPTSRPERPPANDSTRSKQPASNIVRTGGGWRAAVGEITHPVLAHLRSPDRFELVGVNAEGVTFALDATTGVALWSTGRRTQSVGTMRPTATQSAPLLIKSRSGLDNVVVLSGVNVTRIDGATGRELWRATLPAVANKGAVLSDKRVSEIFLVDNSLQRLFILDGNDGNMVAQIRLPHRVVGAPVVLNDQGVGRVMFAFDSGHVEVRDHAGALVRSGDAGSPATTPPLFVSGQRGGLILVGTRSGLTALGAADLRALGRVVINGDAPRGNLSAEDLNGDGTVEVIMITEHGRIVAVNAADGKTLWEAASASDAEAAAFADVNADGVLDVLIAGGQTFALALSGRDGSIVWKDNESFAAVANHAASLTSRSVVAIPSGPGMLLVAGDPSRTGLRAIDFPKGRAKPDRH